MLSAPQFGVIYAHKKEGKSLAAHKHTRDANPNLNGSAKTPPQHTGRPYVISHHVRTVVACIVIAALVFAASAAAAVWINFDSAIRTRSVDFLEQNGEQEEVIDPNAGKPITFVVIGQDTRDGGNASLSGGTEADMGDHQADTTMVVQISADRSYVNLVSIPRDSLVDAPSCHTSNGTIPAQQGVMFNSIFSTAYREGGNLSSAASCTVQAVDSLTGLHIKNFIVVDFQGLYKMINALGGVDICIPTDLSDTYTELTLKKGMHHLNGLQATQYARMRHGEGTDGSDIMRTTRQQYLVKAIFKEALKKNLLTQSSQLYQLALAAIESLNISSGMANTSALVGLAMSLVHLKVDHIYAQTVPITVAPYDPNRVVWTQAADEVWQKFKEDKPLYGSASEGHKTQDEHKPEATQKPTEEPKASEEPTKPEESQEPQDTGTLDPKTGLLVMKDGTLIDPNTGGIVDPDTGAIKDPTTEQYIGTADRYINYTVCGVTE